MVWSARGELDPSALEFSKLTKSPILWCIKKFIGTYPVFHSTCDEETAYIRQTFGQKAEIVQIPNFIELPDEVERTPGRYVLFLGRVHWKKGIENLIDAIPLSEEFLRCGYVLKIAGRGVRKYQKKLENLVDERGLKEKIQFVGQVEGDDKQRLIADAFWTIMPSHTENFGVVVLESMAQNTPVIASKGSPWEVLEKEGLGFWVDNSPEELARVLDEVFRLTPAEYERYRSQSRGFVNDNFDIGRNIQKWSEAYRKLI
jgi:glycosyltransferase involved in cell wall biosynthesis